MIPRTPSATRRRRVVAALLAGPVLLGAGTAAATAAAHQRADKATAAIVRVDQVGFAPDEAKTAFVLGAPRTGSGGEFSVVDDAGTVVLRGKLGASTGKWNSRYDAVRPLDLSAVKTPGRYRVRLGGTLTGTSPAFTVAPAAELFDGLLAKNVRFFQAQRDGRDVLPEVLGRKPSHLRDETATVYKTPRYSADGNVLQDKKLTAAGGPVDVSGGWFDAGDFLKFTGTTAFATAAMLVTERTAPDVPGLAAEAQHGLRWLDRMWDDETRTLYAQVGIGNGNETVRTDHDVWRLPEDDDRSTAKPGSPDYTISHRPVFRANTPGGPIAPSLAGRTAAAFALAAQNERDQAQAAVWLRKAAAIYAQADTKATENSTAVPAAFYPEDSWQDDLEFAAVELAIAGKRLGDPRAADWQAQAARWATGYIASWAKGTLEVADVSALAHVDLLGLGDPVGPQVTADLRRQLGDAAAVAAKDPFRAGASYTDFDSVPHTFGLVATARMYEKATGDRRYAAFGTGQRGWALGANAWGSSFMIGAGELYPHCPEHQVANLAGQGEVTGAVVNGPNEASLLDELNWFDTMKPCASAPADGWARFDGKGARYVDDVGAWQTVEPAIDFTAVAMLAFAASAR
jgi:hypothetical protein